jgi:hypothetical protein
MGITVEIDYDTADRITKETIVKAIKGIEAVGTIDDVDMWDTLNEALAYFCSPEELEELSNREVSSEWMEIVLSRDAEKKAH